MKRYFTLLLVMAVLVTAGCVEEYTPGTTNVTTAPSPETTTVMETTPVQTPAPVPAEMAYLGSIQCGVGDRSEAAYHCNGNVRIQSGAYNEVMVIARYPDNNTFKSGILSLGGGNPVSGPFVTFPDLKYQGQNPEYFIKLDKTLYPVSWDGTTGVAWSNTSGAEGVEIP
jgi:hypothetical protein